MNESKLDKTEEKQATLLEWRREKRFRYLESINRSVLKILGVKHRRSSRGEDLGFSKFLIRDMCFEIRFRLFLLSEYNLI